MSAECDRCPEAIACVAGELSPRAHWDFEIHAAICAECQAALEATRQMTRRLQAVSEVESASDLAPLILARLRKERSKLLGPARWTRVATLAAMAALCAAIAFRWSFQKSAARADRAPAELDENAAGVSRALTWLCRHQEPDGSWDAEKWGGNRRFQVALTALPALALLSAEPLAPENAAAAARAVQWLQSQQARDGSFGPDFPGASYNQSIATLALVHAFQSKPDAALKHSLGSALQVIAARQTTDGGWGYLHSPLADRPITESHLEALELARALGFGIEPALERGRKWLAAHSPPHSVPEGLLAFSSDPSAQAPGPPAASQEKLDLYGAYLLATALKQQRNDSSKQRLAAIRHALLIRQVTDGANSGSWPADDRWGSTGGRLYSTALASLSVSSR